MCRVKNPAPFPSFWPRCLMTAPACCLCIAPFINLLQPCSPPQYDQTYIASLRYLIYTSGFVSFGFFYLWDSSPVSGFASVCHQALPSASKCHSIYHLILWFQQLRCLFVVLILWSFNAFKGLHAWTALHRYWMWSNMHLSALLISCLKRFVHLQQTIYAWHPLILILQLLF